LRLTFLGTGAAEGFPALWCRCQRCQTARARGGRNLRFRSAALINDDLLLDVGPDLVASAVRLGLDLAPVQALLVTHPHSDHLDPTVLMWRRKGFVTTPLPPLQLYGSARTIERATRPEGQAAAPESLRVIPHAFRPFQRFEVATGGPPQPDPRFPDHPQPVPETPRRRYEVWTLGASHARPEDEACIFVVRQVEGPEVQPGGDGPGAGPQGGAPGGAGGARALLYATDTGPFPPETWEALDRLGAEGLRLQATAVDSTLGDGPDGTGHMSVHQMAAHQEELARRGLLAPGARRLGHHFSHGRTPPYEELCAILEPRGIEVAYDGLSLSL
jgi:phosphoribosyl 1,2-cyclic phosphate phosphodiesterase